MEKKQKNSNGCSPLSPVKVVTLNADLALRGINPVNPKRWNTPPKCDIVAGKKVCKGRTPITLTVKLYD